MENETVYRFDSGTVTINSPPRQKLTLAKERELLAYAGIALTAQLEART